MEIKSRTGVSLFLILLVGIICIRSVAYASKGVQDIHDKDKIHSDSLREWWYFSGFVESKDSNHSFGLMMDIEYEKETAACNLLFAIFDLRNGTIYDFSQFDDDPQKIVYQKEGENFSISYKNCHIVCSYPHYYLHFVDDNGTAEINLTYRAVSTPHTILEEVINDNPIPLHVYFGSCKYYFILRNNITGKIRLGNKEFMVGGLGYYEHAWGNWSWSKSFSHFKLSLENLKVYFKIMRWMLKEFLLGERIEGASFRPFPEGNNLHSYDWGTAFLSNGWSIYFAYFPFYFKEGITYGVVYLEEDEKIYHLFGKIYFNYENLSLVDVRGVSHYFPLNLRVIACNEKGEKLSFTFFMRTEKWLRLQELPAPSRWKYIGGIHAKGKVKGFYSGQGERIQFEGLAEIGLNRQFGKKDIKNLFPFFLPFHFVSPPKDSINIQILDVFMGSTGNLF